MAKRELRRDVVTRWPRLTVTEAGCAGESVAALAEFIARRYGLSRSEAVRQVEEWCAGRLDESLSLEEKSRLDGEDAGRGDPRLQEPTVG